MTPQATLVIIFYSTVPFLLLLTLSYLLASRAKLFSLEFAFWLIAYQFIFIGALSVGLVQSHIGCPMPLGECYVDGYPVELEIISSAIGFSMMAWVLGAIAIIGLNVVSIFKKSA